MNRDDSDAKLLDYAGAFGQAYRRAFEDHIEVGLSAAPLSGVSLVGLVTGAASTCAAIAFGVMFYSRVELSAGAKQVTTPWCVALVLGCVTWQHLSSFGQWIRFCISEDELKIWLGSMLGKRKPITVEKSAITSVEVHLFGTNLIGRRICEFRIHRGARILQAMSGADETELLRLGHFLSEDLGVALKTPSTAMR